MVLSKPEGRYVAVWASAVKSPGDAPSEAPEQASIQSPPPNSEKLTEKGTKYKPVPKWAGPTGPLAKWMETGEPPSPDDLPLGLAPSARARLWSLYDVASALNISPDEVLSLLRPRPPESVTVLASGEKHYLWATRHYEALSLLTEKTIADFHLTHPLSDAGRTSEELQGILALGSGDEAKEFPGYRDSLGHIDV